MTSNEPRALRAHRAGLHHVHAKRSALLAALLSSTALMLTSPQALAQSTWTGATSDYNTGTNWDNSTAPVSAGQSAIFDATGNTTVNVSSAVSPDSWTFNSSSQSYTVTGSAVTLGGGGLADSASGQTISISNNLAGTGGVTMSDTSGSLTLTGTNTYSGGTTITAGTLTAASTALGTGTVTINGGILALSGTSNYSQNIAIGASGGTINGGSSSLEIDGVLSGSGALTKTGSATLSLAGNNSYSGTLTISQGNVAVLGSNSLSSAKIVNNGIFYVFDVSGSSASIQSLTGNSSSSVQLGSKTLNITNASGTYSGTFSTGSGGTLQISGGSLTLTGGGFGPGSEVSITGGTLSAHPPQLGQATIILNGGTLATNGGTYSNDFVIGSSGGTITSPNNNVTIAGSLSGSGTLTKGSGSDYLNLDSYSSFTGTISIPSNGTVELVNRGTFAGALTGVGYLNINSGTVIVTGDSSSSFTGKINSSSNGVTLQIGNGGTTGSLGNGNISMGPASALTVDRADDLTIAGTISGLSTLSQIGTGTLILAANNSYGGTTTINAGGTIQVGNGGTTGSLGVGSVTDNGTLVFDRSNSITVANSISGSGALSQTGTGTLILTSTNTYSGATTIDAGATLNAGSTTAFSAASAYTVNGTLDLKDNSNSIGSLSGGGTVTNNGSTDATLTVGAANSSTTFSGVLTDGSTNALALSVTGSGTLILTGANTYSGITTIASGATLQIDSGGTTGTLGSGSVTNNGALLFDRSNSTTVANAISGTGSVTQQGSGTLTLTGANSYSGGTSITSGNTVELDSTGSLGTGTVTNNGTLIFNRGDANANIPSDMSGSGSVTYEGTNGYVLTGNSSYTGGTTIQQGAVQIGNGGTTGSISGNIVAGVTTSNSGINFDRSDNITFSGNISGLGYVAQQGIGTLTLTGNNSYGSTTDVANGTIAFASDSNIGSGDVRLVGGNVQFNAGFASAHNYQLGNGAIDTNGNDVSISGVLSTMTNANVAGGYGGLTKIGGGTLTLTAINSYAGPTLVSSGTLALSGSGSIATSDDLTDNATFDISGVTASTTIAALAGNGTVNLGAERLVISAGSSAFSGTITGSGGVTVSGGTQTFSGANSYAGVTTINSGGTLALSGGGSVASGVSDAGTFDISATSSGASITTLFGGGGVSLGAKTLTLTNAVDSFSGIVSGTGGLAISGGTETLTGANSYTGATSIAGGATLALSGSGGIASSSSVTDDGTFDISGITASSTTIAALSGSGTVDLGSKQLMISAGSGAFTGSFSGTGALGISGGTTTFTTTVSNDVTVDSGATLQIGGGGTSGAVTGTVTDNGTVAFNRSDSVTYANAISGTGALTQMGTGTLILTGANTYTGATTINTGSTLQAGSGAASGSLGSGSVTDNGNLVLDRSDTITVANVISGSGTLTQLGSGTVILDGADTYTGITTVSNGTLEVGDAATPGASLAGPVNVLSTGTLSGHGTVQGAVTVASGGSLRPGGTIGTLTVNGNLSLPAGSTFVAELSPAAADQAKVSGAASLGGNLQLIADPGTYAATDYKLISASSVIGTFASVSGQVSGFTNTVQYSATGVDLILSTPSSGNSGSGSGSSGSGSSGNNGSGGGGSTPPVTTFLFGSYGATPNQIAAGNALTASSPSGALYTAMGALVGSSTASVPGALGQLAGDIRPSLRAAAIEDSRLVRDTLLDHLDHDSDGIKVWGAGFAGYGRLASDGSAANLHHDSAGFLAGVDMPVMADVILGVDGGYSSNSARTPGRLSAASGDSGHVGAYASFHPGALRFVIGGDYGFGSVTINRTVPQLGLATTAAQDQQTGQVFADLGYRFALDAVGLEPHAGIAHIVATGGSFAETGSVAALSGNEKSDAASYSLLGVRANLSDMPLDDDLTLVPRFDLGWQHALGRLTPYQTVSYVNAATSFLVSGTPLAQDAAALQAGFDLKLAPSAILSISYDGSFSATSENHGFHGVLSWRF